MNFHDFAGVEVPDRRAGCVSQFDAAQVITGGRSMAIGNAAGILGALLIHALVRSE